MWLRSLLLTGEQLRAARALARLEQAELARRCGLSLETIKRLERIRGPVDANVRTLAAIAQVFHETGIVFDTADGSVGVRMAYPDAGPETTSKVTAPRHAQTASLHRLIYYSTAQLHAATSPEAVLDAIVKVSVARNGSLGITGALMACEGRFLQVLEGSKAAVQQIYGSICTDPRHAALHVLQSRAVGSRQFAEWSLCAGVLPVDEEVLAEPAFANGFQPETLSPAAALGLLTILSDLRKTPQAA